MRTFILRRIGQSIVVLWALITILFILFRLLPGDPLMVYLDIGLPPEDQAEILQQFGLDQPIWRQYILYIYNAFQGDFGISFHYRQPVTEIIAVKFWPTMLLMSSIIFMTYSVGILLGAILGWHRGSRAEPGLISVALAFKSAPVFWTGMLAIGLFSVILGWFPLGGMRAVGQNPQTWAEEYLTLEFLHHLILPTIIGMLYHIGTPLLLMRSTLLEVLDEDYVELARAKGLTERVVLFRHAMRNALLPITTVLAVSLGSALGGQVLIEVIFRWPGMGREIVQAVGSSDYPLSQALFFTMGTMTIAMNLVADLVYGYLDPRIVYD
jgi:peptide/nickel transport system permease protein